MRLSPRMILNKISHDWIRPLKVILFNMTEVLNSIQKIPIHVKKKVTFPFLSVSTEFQKICLYSS